MKQIRALLLATLGWIILSAGSPVYAQSGSPTGEWSFPAATSLPLLNVSGDGTYRWGNTRGQLVAQQPGFASAPNGVYFGGLADAEGALLIEVRSNSIALRRASGGAVLAEATRRQSNALEIEWVSAQPLGGSGQQPKPEAPRPEAPKPEAPKPEAPKPPSSGTKNPLDIEWYGANPPQQPKPDAPKPDAPKPDAPKPPSSGTKNPLDIEWYGANPPQQPKPEPTKPEPTKPEPAKPTQPRPYVVSVAVRPAEITLARGDSVQFEAFVNYSDGSSHPVDRPYWDMVGGSISGTGVYRALNNAGTYEIMVRDMSSGQSGTAKVIVTNARLLSLQLEPANETRITNWETQMKAIGTYSDRSSRTVTGIRFTASGGRMTPDGVFSAPTPGRYTITATDASGITGTTILTVIEPQPARLQRVILTPADTQVASGAKVRFELLGYYDDGATKPLITTFQATGGTIDGSGIYTAGTAIGTYMVKAPDPVNGGTIDARVTVTRPQLPLVALEITPADTTVLAGASLYLSVRARYSDGSTRPSDSFLMTATGGSVQSNVDGTGYYTAPGSVGTYTITASHWQTGVKATARVKVVNTPPTPPKPNYSGVCRDPWLTEAITGVMGRKPNGEADTAECDYRRYGGGRWNSKAELRRHVETAFGRPVSPVRALYVLDGTDSKYIHQNAMWHLYQQWEDHRYFQDGVNLLATNIDAAYQQAYDRICQDIKPKSQGGLGIQEVFLAGYSRGAMMAVRMSQDVQSGCGAKVVFVGLVDAVNTNIWNWPVRVPANVPVRIHLRKGRDWEHVLTTRDIENVTTLRHPKDVDHKGIVCKVGDMDEWRWTTDRLIESARSAGGTFGPALNEPTKC